MSMCFLEKKKSVFYVLSISYRLSCGLLGMVQHVLEYAN